MIIGLLAGGILKGQQMIENAKYKAWVKEIDALRTAVYAFQDHYHYFPGDFPRANTKLPTVGGVSGANGNGVIDDPAESHTAYHHLVLAGLVTGDATCTDIQQCYKDASVGGFYGYLFTNIWAATGRASIKAGFYNIPASYAKRLDEEFDDGKANAGTIVCNAVVAASIAIHNCTGTSSWPTDDKYTSLQVEM